MEKGNRVCLKAFQTLLFGVMLGFLVPAMGVFAQVAADKPGASTGAKLEKKAGKEEKGKPPAGDKAAIGLGTKVSKANKEDKTQPPPPFPGKGIKGEGPKGNKEDKGKDDKGPEGKPALPKGDDHIALSIYHRNAMEHVKALYQHANSNAQVSKALVTEHVDEIGRSLEAAKRHYAAIEKISAENPKLKARHEALKASHVNASEQLGALKSEAAKPAPDANVIKEKASGVYSALKGAEGEHKPMKGMHKVKDPTEPPANAEKRAKPATAATPATPAKPAAPAKPPTPAKPATPAK